ncbi:hypothetical protein AALP_AAs63184U000200 [Arabis alpina]|uniref:TIR domain-containing protein n=1 Tax=Arabis alpina TaxID=50452 RepID=A0A087FXF8_ARAAL|nr:hypothetical protein AALP_AAs63184U000200 [Arabis alpina]
MALPSSSSSSTSRSWRFNVFASFHGPDVRVTFLSHLRKEFERSGIIIFNDQEIERSQTIKPELTRAIQESRILIVVLSQNYASSSWCLNELVEILRCKETTGQIVMTVFYKVDPSDVRKQTGEFGKTFKKTCIGKVETEIQSWTKALTQVANIEGEHTLNWVNEADMIEKISIDISNKLNETPSKDFNGMVGLEAHLAEMKSLLHLGNDGTMIVGIAGPAGIDAREICDILEYDKGTRVVSGISFDTSQIGEVFISANAFKRMQNLRFLNVHRRWYDKNDRVYIPEEMEFPPRLRLVHWDAYPRKSLPPKFHPEHLVELNMQDSQLEKLWEGTQRFTNLKKIELMESCHLKELPDLSNATKLERLDLTWCQSLVEIPSTFSNLHKLKALAMFGCTKLQVIPTHLNLASLEFVDMAGCSRLKKFPDFSTNITAIKLSNTSVEEVPESIQHWSGLRSLELSCNGKLKTLRNVPESVTHLDLSYSGIEKISDCIKSLHGLQHLNLCGCRKLTSLPELPAKLMFLSANDCESLKTVFRPFYTPNAHLNFTHCFKLGQQARRAITEQPFLHGWALLPGREVPAEFDHRAIGNSLTIPLPAFTRYKVCLVISPNNQTRDYRVSQVLCRLRRIRKCELCVVPIEDAITAYRIPKFRTEHLFVFHTDSVEEDESISEIVFEFSSKLHDFEIIECGVQILRDEIERNMEESYDSESSDEEEPVNSDRKDDKHTNCWSWFSLCFDISGSVRSIAPKFGLGGSP